MNDEVMESKASADRLTFYRNWFEGVDAFPDDMRLAWYDSVMRFAFRDEEPGMPTAGNPLSAISWNAVQMVRESIKISRMRREFGAKPKQKRSKRKANTKQNGSKTEANTKQEQEQVQVKEQEQEQYANMLNATSSAQACAGKMPTIEQFVQGGTLAGVPEDFCRKFYGELVAAGWADRDGRPVGNWRRYLKTSWNDEQKNFAAACDDADALAAIPMAR